MFDLDLAIARHCEQRHGIITAGDLVRLGIDDDVTYRRSTAGLLVVEHEGVYRHAACPPTAESELLAAILAVGRDAAASGPSAMRLFDIRGTWADRPEVTYLGATHLDLPGIDLRRIDRLDPGDVHHRAGIPVLAPPLALLLLGASVPAWKVATAVHDMVFQRFTTRARLIDVLVRYGKRGRRGTRAFRRAVRSLDPDGKATQTNLELRILDASGPVAFRNRTFSSSSSTATAGSAGSIWPGPRRCSTWRPTATAITSRRPRGPPTAGAMPRSGRSGGTCSGSTVPTSSSGSTRSSVLWCHGCAPRCRDTKERNVAGVLVAVTGGAGFIGANLCHTLLERGHDVVVLDDLSTGSLANLDGLDPDHLRFVRGSILDDAALDDALPGAASVVHLAARPSVPKSVADPVASHAANATGTLSVLEGIRRHAIGHVVVASSSSVYGANEALPKHEGLVPMPVSPYAASKLATESYALAWAASYGLRALAFRFFNVFGPLQPAGHDYAAVVPAFVDAALAGRPLPIHGDGEQSRDFTFVGSVANVITDAVDGAVAHDGPVNLAFGSRITLLELIAELERVLGTTLQREHLPTRAGDVRHSQADQARFRSLFPDAQPVPLADGLARTVDWFRSLQSIR